MSSIYSYIYSIAVISVAAGSILLMSPEKSPTARYVKFIVSLCVLAALIMPLKRVAVPLYDMLSSIGDSGVAVSDMSYGREELVKAVQSNIEESVIKALNTRYGTENISCEAVLSQNSEGEEIVECIKIYFSDRGEWYRKNEIEKYAGELLGSRSEAILID